MSKKADRYMAKKRRQHLQNVKSNVNMGDWNYLSNTAMLMAGYAMLRMLTFNKNKK